MSEAVIERDPLKDTALNIWWLDVDTTPDTETATWKAVNGIYDFKGAVKSDTSDFGDFNSGDWTDEQVTKRAWTLDFKIWRKKASTGTAYDPGQEFLRTHDGRTVHIRYYEMPGDGTATGMPRVEAYAGTASVAWADDGGKKDDGRSVSVTLSGKGGRATIAHPNPNKPAQGA